MLKYCVTLKIENSIKEEFLVWLEQHVIEMLELSYFSKSTTFNIEGDDSDNIEIEVQYDCNSREELEAYFSNEAKKMRGDGLSRFSGKFSASRRILNLIS